MRVAHILRKYHPAEWGGTESAVKQLADGLGERGVKNILFCPAIREKIVQDPFAEAGHEVKRYRACVPVWGISREQRAQLVSNGGNLLSLDLLWKLLREPGLSVVHCHAINRLGGIGLTAARARRVPFLVTIHGGVLDLPPEVSVALRKPLEGGLEWGKLFGLVFRSRKVLEEADAIVTCNRREAELLRLKFPRKEIMVQPHGVCVASFEQRQTHLAEQQFPTLSGRRVLLVAGRIDPVKNQAWVVRQMPSLLARIPELLLVIAGSCTDETYGKMLKKEIRSLGLEDKILLTGGLPPGDPRLIGLFQRAEAIIVPSLSETFGLVILEAWAAGRPVISTKTSGACDLIQQGNGGFFFDLDEPETFHSVCSTVVSDPRLAEAVGGAGYEAAVSHYDARALAGRMAGLYQRLCVERRRL